MPVSVRHYIITRSILFLAGLFCLLFVSNQVFSQAFNQKQSVVNLSSPQFQSRSTAAITMDANGRIWIGTLNGLFISKGNTIVPIELPRPNDKVISTLHLSGRYVYVGSNEGISRINIDSLTSSVILLKDEHGNSINNYCMVVRVSGGKMLYYTGYNSGAYYEYDFESGESKFLVNQSDGFRAIKTDERNAVTKIWAVETTGLIEHDLSVQPVSTRRYFKTADKQVLSIPEAHLDGTDTLWCATNKGLVGMDVNTHGYRQISFAQYGVYEIIDLVLTGSQVICATKDAGLVVWNRRSNTSYRILHRPDDGHSLISNNIEKLQVINDKLLLVATDIGVSVLVLDQSLQFAYTTSYKGTVNCIVAGRQHWLTGIGNKVLLADKNSFAVKDSIRLGEDEYMLTAKELKDRDWLVVTNKNVLWWRNAAVTRLTTIPVSTVICERIVKQNDSNYYFCGQTGIYTWHLGNNYITWLRHTDNEPYQWYSAVIPVNDSVVFSNAYLSFIKGHKRVGDKLSPIMLFKMSGNVNDWLVENSNRVLLAGTNGISYINIKDKSLRFADTSFHENIFRILCRTTDTLLVGEHNVYRLKGGRILPFSLPFTGLQSINSPDRLVTENRSLWYTNGTELYHMPLHLPVDTAQYYHVDVRYNGLVAANDIVLPASTNLLLYVNSISYLPYIQPKIQYRLAGIEGSWNTLDGEQVRYTQLQPGTYKLLIQAVAGTQVLYSRQVTITAKPAWYQTIWATVGFALVVIGVIYFLFSLRVRAINRKAQQALMLQRQMNELENKALRAQMNPHFLFNTLNSINHYILNNDTREASHYLTRFSKLVRLVLDNSRREYISLEKELEALNIYLELEMMRRNNEFDYSIAVKGEVDASSFMVPPLILQPFVENAIWHGLSTISKDGFIEITVNTIDDDGVCIAIEDNGIGYKAPAAEVKKGHNSFGMAGTKDRLVLMHPKNNYHIDTLYDEKGTPNGTRVSVYIYND